jgi:hypothetical protein
MGGSGMLPRSKKGQLVAVPYWVGPIPVPHFVNVGICIWELPSYIGTMAAISTDVTSLCHYRMPYRPPREWNHSLTYIQQGYLPPIEGNTKRTGS